MKRERPDGSHPSGLFNQRVRTSLIIAITHQREGSSVTVLHDAPVVPVAIHPTPCPSWCKHRHLPMAHSFGPTSTAHWSPQAVLPNPNPLPGSSDVVLRAELYRGDEGSDAAETLLYLQGETDIDLTVDEADIFIAQAQAFVDTLRVLRRQMR